VFFKIGTDTNIKEEKEMLYRRSSTSKVLKQTSGEDAIPYTPKSVETENKHPERCYTYWYRNKEGEKRTTATTSSFVQNQFVT